MPQSIHPLKSVREAVNFLLCSISLVIHLGLTTSELLMSEQIIFCHFESIVLPDIGDGGVCLKLNAHYRR